jgi:hypothetical protein
VQLPRPDRRRLSVRIEAGIHQPPVEALGLHGRVERDRVLHDTGRAEVVRHRADRDHQNIIGERAHRRDRPPLLVEGRRQMHLARGPVDAGHLAEAVGEPVPVRLGEVIELVAVDVHAAGRDLVQQWLPHVRPRPVDQRDIGRLAPPVLVAELGRQFKAARPAPDHDDVRPLAGRHGHRRGGGCGGFGWELLFHGSNLRNCEQVHRHTTPQIQSRYATVGHFKNESSACAPSP